jgi:hypothetical protein
LHAVAVDTFQFETRKPGIIDRVAKLHAQTLAHALPPNKLLAREAARRR